VALSTTSTVVVVAITTVLFLLAPRSAQVRHTFFSPADLWQSLIGAPAKGYYSVGAATWLNIRMFLVAEVFILGLAEDAHARGQWLHRGTARPGGAPAPDRGRARLPAAGGHALAGGSDPGAAGGRSAG
jgi:hypothetical protein